MCNSKTIINGKTVGSGHWKMSSIKNYCIKKGVDLVSASYVSYDINYGFDYDHLDIKNGTVRANQNSDTMRSHLGL